MAFAARRSLATRLSHHFTRRIHPGVPHALTSRAEDEPACPSTPPPPLQAPLLRGSGAAQTLGLLPFSLHLTGTTCRSFSSNAPDSAPPAEVDATTLLVDAADVAASVPAPYPGEVAAAAADSFLPVAALQHVIDAVHSFTGLNWWASIALTTILIRSLTIPVLVKQLKVAAAKLNASSDLKSPQERQMKMQALFKKHGYSLFFPLKGMLLQGPIFMSFFFAIKNMVEKVPSMQGGGTLWFTDLTTPDSLYIFPVLTGLTYLAKEEINLQKGMEGHPMTGATKIVSRGVAFMIVPFTMSFSKGYFCYWFTSNIFSVVFGIVLKRPAVRKLFNIPESVHQPSAGTKPTFNLFGGSKAVPPAQPPPALVGSRPDAAALGYRVKNLEKKVKSRGKSKKRR
jgi:YidC/Oxa1 family membrane protein insertase